MHNKIQTALAELEPQLRKLNEDIYNTPELGDQEFKACRWHIELLESHGFDVEHPYMDIPTAFKATFDTGKPGPAIAYMSEYDALPGIGHGCGHNLLGTVGTGAAITLSKILESTGGQIVLFGTPAEEINGAKVDFADAGVFDGITAALMAHPSADHCLTMNALAIEAIEFSFKGKTAHAASSPEKGINALDGCINTFNMVNAMREHIRTDARIHGIIREGGKAANIVPDLAIAEFYVRAKTKTYLSELVERVKNCARGASLGAGTELSIRNYEKSYDNFVTNPVPTEIYKKHLIDAGAVDILEVREGMGSTDAGNASQVVPTLHAMFKIGDSSLVPHTVEFADATITEEAYMEMKRTIEALALTGYELLNNVDLRDQVKQAFDAAEK